MERWITCHRAVYPRECGGTPLPSGQRRFIVTPAVYPRECGGTPLPSGQRRASYGLSPRVRGNRGGVARDADYQRSIPASAGEPLQLVPGHPLAEVYPRECGGTVDLQLMLTCMVGLSPRVRGNLDPKRFTMSPLRSIPASAGEPRS